MEEQKKAQMLAQYNRKTHIYGRIFSIIAIVLMLGAPFAMGAALDATPDLAAFFRGFLAIGLVYVVTGIAEYLIYTPMLGAGGSYLAYITGNLINMKIPCAINARDIVGVRSGTDENEIISTLSIATSSLVTILVLALGVLLLQPLQPILQSPTLEPAFSNVVPALFGAMAYKYYREDLKVAAITLTCMTLLFVFVPSLTSQASIMIIPSGAIAIGVAYWQFRKEQQQGGKLS